MTTLKTNKIRQEVIVLMYKRIKMNVLYNLLGIVHSFRKHYGHCDVRVTLSTLREIKKLVNAGQDSDYKNYRYSDQEVVN